MRWEWLWRFNTIGFYYCHVAIFDWYCQLSSSRSNSLNSPRSLLPWLGCRAIMPQWAWWVAQEHCGQWSIQLPSYSVAILDNRAAQGYGMSGSSESRTLSRACTCCTADQKNLFKYLYDSQPYMKLWAVYIGNLVDTQERYAAYQLVGNFTQKRPKLDWLLYLWCSIF